MGRPTNGREYCQWEPLSLQRFASCKEKTKNYSCVDAKIQPDKREKEEQQTDALPKLSYQEYRRKQS